MKKKQISVLLVVFLFLNVASISLILTTTASTSKEFLDTEPLIFDNTPERFNYEINSEVTPGFNTLQTSLNFGALNTPRTSQIGDPKYWLALDDYNGYYFLSLFELRAESENTEIWVQVNLNYSTDDVRNNPYYQDEDGLYYYPEITQAQIDYLLNQFDSNIYPQDTTYFGTPDAHNGLVATLDDLVGFPSDYYYDEAGRNVILVENVRDAAYYEGFRFYIAGFFSSQLEGYFDRNIITIDSHQWYRRTGPEGYVWHSEVLGIDYPPVDRPYLYEGTIAHEYQHLLHSDYVPGDLLIMNEGFSVFAEYLCGYGIPVGDINYFLATPDNSLTEWGDQQGDENILADYGQAFLWAAYLSDHFGGSDFLSYYMDVGIPGFEGIQNALDHFGAGLTFDEVFHDWRIANLIHSDSPGKGRYNYDTIDLGSKEFIPIRVYDLEDNWDYDGSPWPKDLTGYGFNYTVCWDEYPLYDTYLVSSYGSDYIRFDNPQGGFFSGFEFNGQDDIPVPGWVIDTEVFPGVWWSDGGDLDERVLAAYVTVPEMGVVELTFDTIYNIEELWDFGFVQVSEDNGESWTSLANEFTTSDYDPEALSTIVANLPGLTGYSEGWLTMSFDLSAYYGKEIMIAFRYMTDWAYSYDGWWVDVVVIEQDDVVVQTVTDFFTPYPKTDFMVTLLRVDYWRNRPYYTIIYDMTLDDASDGTVWLFPFALGRADMIAIISPRTGPADYSFSLNKHIMKFCKF